MPQEKGWPRKFQFTYITDKIMTWKLIKEEFVKAILCDVDAVADPDLQIKGGGGGGGVGRRLEVIQTLR